MLPVSEVLGLTALAVGVAALILNFFVRDFYNTRVKVPQDHWDDLVIAQGNIESYEIAPRLVQLYRHLHAQMVPHPDDPPESFLVTTESSAMVKDIMGQSAKSDGLRILYDRMRTSGDIVWKWSFVVVITVLAFPALYMFYRGLISIWSYLVLLSAAIVVFSFVDYTRARDGFLKEIAENKDRYRNRRQ